MAVVVFASLAIEAWSRTLRLINMKQLDPESFMALRGLLTGLLLQKDALVGLQSDEPPLNLNERLIFCYLQLAYFTNPDVMQHVQRRRSLLLVLNLTSSCIKEFI